MTRTEQLLASSKSGNMEAKEMLVKEFPDCRVEIVDLTPAFTTQGGPRCVAIQSMIDVDK